MPLPVNTGVLPKHHSHHAVLSLYQFSSVTQSFSTLQPHRLQRARLPVHHQVRGFTKPMSIESVMPCNRLILCCPLLPSVFPSIRVFSSESVFPVRWPKYWSFSFSISPFNEYPGLISFRMDWLDLLAVQGTLVSITCCHLSSS